MRMLKLGALLGFGVGYVLGAKAGRERYEQIQRTFDEIKASPMVEKAMGTARSVTSRGPLGGFAGNGAREDVGSPGFGAR